MATKNDLAAAIAKVATDVAAAHAADQAKIADLEAQLAGSASGATDAELASMLDAVNAIETSIGAPAAQAAPFGNVAPVGAISATPAPVTQFLSGGSTYPAPVPVVDRSALPFDPNAGG